MNNVYIPVSSDTIVKMDERGLPMITTISRFEAPCEGPDCWMCKSLKENKDGGDSR